MTKYSVCIFTELLISSGNYLRTSKSRVQKHEACAGVWGYRPPENFQIWRLRNVIFSICHEICLRKIDLEYENGKQLQVTITKITKSKEFIHRIDVQLPPLPPR